MNVIVDSAPADWVDLNGLETIREPENGSTPDVDIVCIHGLGNRWQQTWGGSKKTCSWLQSQVPQTIPGARIWTYGFNVIKHPGSDLLEGSQRLLQDLKVKRPETARPLLFLAHSLGGIILENALMYNTDQSLETSICGIVLLGTLTTGNADRTDFGNVFDRLGRLVKLTPTMEEVDRLHATSLSFTTWVRNHHFSHRICCVFETLPVYRIGIVVPQKNAVIDGCAEVALTGNHVQMAKSDEESSPDYQVLIEWLKLHLETSYTDLCSPDISLDSAQVSPDLGPNARTGHSDTKVGLAPDRREIITQSTVEDGTRQAKTFAVLALALEDQGEYGEAEIEFKKAANEYEERLGVVHPKTLFCMDKLASLLRNQCKYAKALETCTTVLRLRTQNLETHDDGFLLSLGNLALLLHYLGKYESAIALIRDSLDFIEVRPLECVVGTGIVGIFAKMLLDHEHYGIAELLLRDVISASIARLEPDHPFILNCVSDLAKTLSKRGQLADAERLYRYALDKLEMRLGTDHPYALRTGRRLGKHMLYECRYSDACLMLQRILPDLKSQLGYQHHETMSAMEALASAYIFQGFIREGEQLLEELLNLQMDILGKDHDHSSWTEQHCLWTSNVLQRLRSTDFQSSSQIPELARAILHLPTRPQQANTNNINTSTKSTVWAFTSFNQIASMVAGPEVIGLDVLNALHYGAGSLKMSRTSSWRHRVKLCTHNLLTHQTSNDGPDRDEINAQSLRAAAILNNGKSVRSLLNRNVDTRLPGGFYGNAFQAVSLLGNTKVIRLLLEGVQDKSSPCGLFGNPLRAAVIGGQATSVQLLLDRYREIAPDNMMLSSSLEAALMLGQEEIVQRLAGSKAVAAKAANEFFEEPFRRLSEESRRDLRELRILMRQSRAHWSCGNHKVNHSQQILPSDEQISKAPKGLKATYASKRGVTLHNNSDSELPGADTEFQITSVAKPPRKTRFTASHNTTSSRNNSSNLATQLARLKRKKFFQSESKTQVVAYPADRKR
ncbi:hypothetical protein MMC18_008599 [Xylographa bjoerkii]|nr:hypothetical protein [Xylographa bjoerkii]